MVNKRKWNRAVFFVDKNDCESSFPIGQKERIDIFPCKIK